MRRSSAARRASGRTCRVRNKSRALIAGKEIRQHVQWTQNAGLLDKNGVMNRHCRCKPLFSLTRCCTNFDPLRLWFVCWQPVLPPLLQLATPNFLWKSPRIPIPHSQTVAGRPGRSVATLVISKNFPWCLGWRCKLVLMVDYQLTRSSAMNIAPRIVKR